ncbi:MAG: FAD-dependent oxidoreductase, partial [Gammaproteobacteria bacterium]
MVRQYRYDVLVIGSGASGLGVALQLAEHAEVAVLSKGPLQEGATLYAQGGVSAVLDRRDSVASHVADTLAAGAGLCDAEIVQFVVEHGPESIEWLIALGVAFTRSPDADGRPEYHLTREG